MINLAALSRTFSVLLSRDQSVCLVARHGLVFTLSAWLKRLSQIIGINGTSCCEVACALR
ncbi:Hypothetical protein PMT_2664 [Prochlorococcus marinus str. MIT 9313]|uniref:Uncharacterized protein n=1 Tax=Prochlorococcus marinus (strain MIT 9313) TaxID=74547 RepID=B9ES49_PROMM|nr:Hypothetical protein PMT_2664 [Prochlorococcus marinus str. MIT 9313]